MSTRIMQAAVSQAAVSHAINEDLPVKIEKAANTVKAAQKLLDDSDLPKWFPDVTWTIVEVHAYPFPERIVGHNNRRGAADHLIAFIIVQDAQAAEENHWMYFRILDAMPHPLVELVHTREHHIANGDPDGRHYPPPGKEFDWITQCGIESAEQLGAWLAAIEASVVLKKAGEENARKKRQAELDRWNASPEAAEAKKILARRPRDESTPIPAPRKYTREELEMTQAEARKAWASMPATARLNLVNQRLSTTQQDLYNLHLAELSGENVDDANRDRLAKAAVALEEELKAVQADIEKEQEGMRKQ